MILTIGSSSAVGAFALAIGIFLVARRSASAAYGALIVSLVLASSSIGPVKALFLDLRWAAFAGFALGLARPLPRLGDLSRFQLAVLGLVPLGALSAAWSIDSRLTLLRAASLGILFVGLVLFAHRLARERKAGQRLVETLAVLSVLASLSSLALWVFAPDTAVYVGDLRGIFENQNGLGLFLGLTFGFVAATADLRRRAESWIVLATPIYAGLIALSESRTGMVALIVGICAYELSRRAFRRLAIELALIAGGFVLAFAVIQGVGAAGAGDPPSSRGSLSRSSSILGGSAPGQSRTSSLLGARDEAWAATVELIEERPAYGFGFGTGDRVFEERPDRARFVYFQGANPNNAYLQALLELGVLGVLPVLLLVAPLALVIPQARRGSLEPVTAAFLALLAGGLVTAFFESIFTAAGAPWAALVWLSAFGLAGAALSQKKASTIDHDQRTTRSRSALAAAAVVGVAALAGTLGTYLVAREAGNTGGAGPLPASPDQRREAERVARRIQAAACPDGSCRLAKVERISTDLWRVVVHGETARCHTVDLDAFAVRRNGTLDGVTQVPCLRLPLVRPGTLTVAAEFDLPASDPASQYRIAATRALADQLEIPTVRWVTEDPAAPAAAAARADVVAHPVPQAAVSRPDVDTSFRYLIVDIGVLVPRGREEELDSHAEIASGSIAVGDEFALRYVRSAMPEADVEVFDSPALAIAAARAGRADAVLADVRAFLLDGGGAPAGFVLTGRLEGIEGLVFLLERANGLLDPVNKAIRNLSENGTLRLLHGRYFPRAARLPLLP